MMEQAIGFAQNEHLALVEEIKRTIPIGNLAYCLLAGLNTKMFDLKRKYEHLEKLVKHDGIIWHGNLCLRKEPLVQFVQRHPGYQDWSSRKIVQELKRIDALVLQESGAATVHLSKDSPRVYRIRLDVLQQNAQRY